MMWMDSAAHCRAALRACSAAGRLDEFLGRLTPGELDALDGWWPVWARPDQISPPDLVCPPDTTIPWRVWLILGGRGAGKTRAGAEWVRASALGLDHAEGRPARRIALVGETAADVRDVMIEGESGLLAVHSRYERPVWEPSRKRLAWPNGAVAQAFSAEEPDGLRGPQFDLAWADEIAKWRRADAAWDMLTMALRLGERPQVVATTTPRPIPLLRRLMADPETALSRAATAANQAFLAPGFVAAIERRYGGTRLGRQELLGEIIEDRPGALWTHAMLEACRIEEAPALARILVAVDPPAGSGPEGACGIVAAGVAADGRFYVLEDATIAAARPAQWARRAAEMMRLWDADALVAEVNQGGDMVEAVIRQADASVPVIKVRASRGKFLRAEPVAALYEQGRVRHAGVFQALEDQMCDLTLEGLSDGRSPDRVDALVWALTALSRGIGGSRPRVRGL